MTDGRCSIGQQLRQGREARGLSVEQASAQSRVPVRLVQALESDDYRCLPDALYLIRLLRDYALLLELDPAPLEAELRHVARHPPKISLAPPVAMRKSTAAPWRQILWTVGAILVVVPLVFIALSLASKRASEREEALARAAPASPASTEPEASELRAKQLLAGIEVASEETPAPALAAESPAGPPGAAPASTAPSVPRPAPAPLPPAPTPARSAAREPEGRRHTLLVRAREQTWLAVRADGGAPREVLLQAGQVARFGADGQFRITLGNAGGVTLLHNGVPVSVGGRSGDVVRDLVLPGPAAPHPEPAGAGTPARPAQP